MSTEKSIERPPVTVDGGKIIVTNLDSIQRVAQVYFQAGKIVGATCAADAVVWAMAVTELGISYTAALTGLGFIKGKLIMYGNLPYALAMNCGTMIGAVTEWEGLGPSGEVTPETRCTVTYRRASIHAKDGIQEMGTFSMADAKAAGLLGNPVWKSYPRDMLYNRARSRALRLFADVLNGLGVADEEDVKESAARIQAQQETSPVYAELKAAVERPELEQPVEAAEVTVNDIETILGKDKA